ncbi:unnamed protein product [Lepidochelys kempii]
MFFGPRFQKELIHIKPKKERSTVCNLHFTKEQKAWTESILGQTLQGLTFSYSMERELSRALECLLEIDYKKQGIKKKTGKIIKYSLFGFGRTGNKAIKGLFLKVQQQHCAILQETSGATDPWAWWAAGGSLCQTDKKHQ